MHTTLKKSLIIVAAIVGVGALLVGYYYFGVKSFSESAKVSNDSENQKKESDKPSIQTDPKTEEYIFSDLNKKDGDPFSLPDSLKFKVNPAVDKVSISLKLDNGKIVYAKDVEGGSGDLVIYPDSKIPDNANISIRLEAYKNGKIVTSKTIGVVFQ